MGNICPGGEVDEHPHLRSPLLNSYSGEIHPETPGRNDAGATPTATTTTAVPRIQTRSTRATTPGEDTTKTTPTTASAVIPPVIIPSSNNDSEASSDIIAHPLTRKMTALEEIQFHEDLVSVLQNMFVLSKAIYEKTGNQRASELPAADDAKSVLEDVVIDLDAAFSSNDDTSSSAAAGALNSAPSTPRRTTSGDDSASSPDPPSPAVPASPSQTLSLDELRTRSGMQLTHLQELIKQIEVRVASPSSPQVGVAVLTCEKRLAAIGARVVLQHDLFLTAVSQENKNETRAHYSTLSQLIERATEAATYLTYVHLAQRELLLAASNISTTLQKYAENENDSPSSTISSLPSRVLKSARVAQGVLQKMSDALYVGEETSIQFSGQALDACAAGLGDVAHALSSSLEGSGDPTLQMDLWARTKEMRGAAGLLHVTIREQPLARKPEKGSSKMADASSSQWQLQLSAASQAFASSVVQLVDVAFLCLPQEQEGPSSPSTNNSKDKDKARGGARASVVASSSPRASKANVRYLTEVFLDAAEKLSPWDEATNEETLAYDAEPPPSPSSSPSLGAARSNTPPLSAMTPLSPSSSSSSPSARNNNNIVAPVPQTSPQTSTSSLLTENPPPPPSPTTTGGDARSPVLPSTSKRKVKGGTLNQLLIHLVGSRDGIDMSYIQTFVLTYRSFVTPENLFLKLVQLYDGVNSKKRKAKGVKVEGSGRIDSLIVQSRVCDFVKRWVTLQFPDMSEKLVIAIREWAERIATDGHTSMSKQLLDIIERKRSERAQERSSMQIHHGLEPHLSPENGAASSILRLSDAEEIARALTSIDHMQYCSIRPHELLFQSWNKPELRHQAPNVLRMIQRTNAVALWVATSILWCQRLQERADTFTNAINVAQALRKMGNFNSTMAVISGLQLAAINRLKHTYEKVPARKQQVFNDLMELMSGRRSFKNYREALANHVPPAVPYIGVYLTDLTFIDDGNPNLLPPPPPSPARDEAGASPSRAGSIHLLLKGRGRKNTASSAAATDPNNNGEDRPHSMTMPAKPTGRFASNTITGVLSPHKRNASTTKGAQQQEIKYKLINFRKREQQYAIITLIQQYQQWAYPPFTLAQPSSSSSSIISSSSSSSSSHLSVVSSPISLLLPPQRSPREWIMRVVEDLPHNNEDLLYNLSVLREPRGATKASLR
eukprot:TRINITY_DN4354_c0_g1_i1.p1 TRINITY_DN4354_c0_g1~~TRINITY_DN4354_c0_g1_i1.p1  ORF type:complete len:1180 (+),score=354.98 TRINITY_DN4354_c0_g1_i1:100-3639(+)